MAFVCGRNDERILLPEILAEGTSIFYNEAKMYKAAQKMEDKEQKGVIHLPLTIYAQAALYGAELVSSGGNFVVKEESFSKYSEFLELFQKQENEKRKEILETVLKCAKKYPDQAFLLDIGGPFTILSQLFSPMQLYGSTEIDGLRDVLEVITKDAVSFTKEALNAGITMFSLSDVMGSMDFTGEEYYEKISGYYLKKYMRGIEPFLRGRGICYICGRTSDSLIRSGMRKAQKKNCPKQDSYYALLKWLVPKREISFVGQMCIQQDGKKETDHFVEI